MPRIRRTALILSVSAVWLWVGLAVSSQAQPGVPSGAGLRGTVTSVDGKPLEGVAVSAKAAASTMTTTVWTNLQGE